MNVWEVQSCRACLLQDNVSAMYDLANEDTLNLFNECSKIKISINAGSMDELIPQYLCPMCYKMCELLQTFRDRCYESEKKLRRGIRMKKQKLVEAMKRSGTGSIKEEPIDDEMMEQEGDFSQVALEEPVDGGLLPKEDSSFPTSGTHWSEYDCDSELEPDFQPPRQSHTPSGAKRAKRQPPYTGDDFEENPTASASEVWRYFLRSTDGHRGKCRVENSDGTICGKVLSIIPKSSTGGLHNHLKTHSISVRKRVKQKSQKYEEKSNSA